LDFFSPYLSLILVLLGTLATFISAAQLFVEMNYSGSLTFCPYDLPHNPTITKGLFVCGAPHFFEALIEKFSVPRFPPSFPLLPFFTSV